jgi:hypothetical protein
MMNPKFQVGDIVRIREDIPCRDYSRNKLFCNKDMWNHRGQVAEIESVTGNRFELTNPETPFERSWVWEAEWLDPIHDSVDAAAVEKLL